MTDSVDPAPLLAWYAASARPLPWRSEPDAYRVLLSEFMCQQTRVETARPFFERFLSRWPTIEDLAAAAEQDVLEAWAGLGYYRRARNLHRAAVAAVAAGGMPDTPAGLRALPGIGAYTAGAIASIAFGVAEPAIDGNVQRVLSRARGLDDLPTSAAGKRGIEREARALLAALPAGAHPGDLNQALMELGARVCTPRSPRCGGCPIAAGCRALAEGRVHELPRVAERRPPVAVRAVAGLLATPEGPLLVRNPEDGLLAGLWGPPMATIEPGDDPVEAIVLAFRDVGIAVRVGASLGAVSHVFTHRHLTVDVRAVDAMGGRASAGGRWSGVRFGGDEGISALGRKLIALGAPLPLFLAADRAT